MAGFITFFFFFKFSQKQLKMLFLQVIHNILQPNLFSAVFFFFSQLNVLKLWRVFIYKPKNLYS